VGDYIVVARRNGKDWYVGAMTDWTPRSLEIPLDFLGPGPHFAEMWSDAPETADDPNFLAKEERNVSAQDKIQAKLASGGGWVMHVKPADP
jgi:alpha-glucosidase